MESQNLTPRLLPPSSLAYIRERLTEGGTFSRALALHIGEGIVFAALPDSVTMADALEFDHGGICRMSDSEAWLIADLGQRTDNHLDTVVVEDPYCKPGDAVPSSVTFLDTGGIQVSNAANAGDSVRDVCSFFWLVAASNKPVDDPRDIDAVCRSIKALYLNAYDQESYVGFVPWDDARRRALAFMFLEYSRIDYTDLWMISRRLSNDLYLNGSQLKAEVLRIVPFMLDVGFRAGNLAPAPEKFVTWPNQDPTYVVDRISREWDALGHDPDINDIVWFDGPSGRDVAHG